MRISIAHGRLHHDGVKSTVKRVANVSVDIELLDAARHMKINISETLEHGLRDLVRAEQERRWLRANQEAIASINAFIDRHGLLASQLHLRPPRNQRPTS